MFAPEAPLKILGTVISHSLPGRLIFHIFRWGYPMQIFQPIICFVSIFVVTMLAVGTPDKGK